MLERYTTTRNATEALCIPLITEDYSIQPSDFASPPKWHLAHTTWFWEEFVLKRYKHGYSVYRDEFSFLFNSYYNNVGYRILREKRGMMSRPSVEDVMEYRSYVDLQMNHLFTQGLSNEMLEVIEIGINHEQQHQELLVYDIKYLLGTQPGRPAYYGNSFIPAKSLSSEYFHKVEGGLFRIGHSGKGFSFDNEASNHLVYLDSFEISNTLVTNREYLNFIKEGGYRNFNLWHDEGWQWVKEHDVKAPLYWNKVHNEFHCYELSGNVPLELDQPVKHISFYEAYAFAQWKGMRLPTELEWEVASGLFDWGELWEWTASAYLPYPRYRQAEGALGEYNGKFMVNQMVMRGGSVATPPGHTRKTYRNFFHPSMRWMYGGIRLATHKRTETIVGSIA